MVWKAWNLVRSSVTANFLKDLACLMVWKAWNLVRSSVTAMARTLLTAGLTGITSPANCTALDSSSGVESPFLGFLELMGNRINLLLYSFKRWAFNCRDSTLLFLRRWSTAMPMVWA